MAANSTNPSAANQTIGNLAPAGPYDLFCPPSQPFFVNGTCVSCDAPTPYFFPALNDCVACPTNNTYDPVTHSCVFNNNTLPYISNLNASRSWVSASPYKDYKDNTQALTSGLYQPCPSNTPFFDGSKCIACPVYFNVTTRQCVTCPSDQTFDTNAQKCIYNTPGLITNPNTAPNLIYHDTPAGEYKYDYNQAKSASNPPADCVLPTPYYNGNRCI